MSKKTTICLCCIVKDESKVIKRLIDSCRDIIDYWVIVDTGSLDNTKKIIRQELKDIPGELHDQPWVNFGHNRTQLMEYAKDKADYLLLADADFEIKKRLVRSLAFNKNELKYNAYHLRYQGDIDFAQILLVKGSLPWKYIGVTHEFIYTDNIGNAPILDTLQILHHADGGHRAEKLDRDIALLTKAIEDNPDDSRSYFYLAQTYSNKGDLDLAIKYYSERVKRGGWPEEIFYSLFQIGVLLYKKGDQASATHQLQEAYSYRPIRFEPLYTLGLIMREQKKYHLAKIYLNEVLKMAYPVKDMLFIHKYNKEYLADFELAICNYWIEDYDRALEHATKVKECKNVVLDIKNQNDKNLEYIQAKLDKKKSGLNDLIYCSMFTVDTPYEEEIKNLQQSLDKYSIKYELVGLKSRGDWVKNTQMKPGVIKGVMEKHNKDVVWLDADAVLVDEPNLFETIKQDVSFHYIKEWNEMLTGTLFFRNNDRVKEFLNNWDALNKSNNNPDAVNFQALMQKNGDRLSIFNLPPEYIKIFDNPLIKTEKPVVMHYQASRRFKDQVKIDSNQPSNNILTSLRSIITQKRCAVIGNGPFASDYSSLIDDSFVMRCNKFKTGDAYKGLGTRTDLNISSLYHEIIPNKKVDYPILHVLPISETLYQKYTDAKMMHIHWRKNGKYLSAMGNTVWMYGDDEIYAEVFESVAKEINAFPTVGIMAIATARWLGFEEILISGFTFFESKKSHYWSDKVVTPSSHHNVRAEKLLLEKWIMDDDRKYIMDKLLTEKLNIQDVIVKSN